MSLATFAVVALLSGCGGFSAPTGQHLIVAISPDIPPYVMDGAQAGLEVDLVSTALAGHQLQFSQMPYAALEAAVASGQVDIALGVQQMVDGVFYSRDFVTFANAAISRTKDQLTIGSVDELKDLRVLAWENAYLELGADFEQIFSPGTPYWPNYAEAADQRHQVQALWDGDTDVVVIDRSIFYFFSTELGHDAGDFTEHDLFPPVTNFKAAFASPRLRDEFDRGLADLCANGGHAALLQKYQMQLETTVCDLPIR